MMNRIPEPHDPPPSGEIELSIVMPCLNEAETLGTCIRKAHASIEKNGIAGEVVVADNGSTDGSQAIASRLGARVVEVLAKGYGSALAGGIRAARGRYIIMGDADDSYDFSNIMPFVEMLRAGHDLVMGNRFKGGIAPGAMRPLHRYLGNPVLTGIGRLFFKSACGDFHCGLRAFTKQAFQKMDLRTSGMEFASEMVVKAALLHLHVAEVPTTLSRDGRSRPPHLRSWRDGWRHLRFLLLCSPRWLFLYPGLGFMAAGILLLAALERGPVAAGHVRFDVHTMLYAAMIILVGFQSVSFAVFTKAFAAAAGILPEDQRLTKVLRFFSLEVGLVTGSFLIAIGVIGTLWAINDWGARSFGDLEPAKVMRIVIPSAIAATLGVQVVLSSFFISFLSLSRHQNPGED